MSSLPKCPKCEHTVISIGTVAGTVRVLYCSKCGCIISVIKD